MSSQEPFKGPWRDITLGKTLLESLDELKAQGYTDDTFVASVMNAFDQSCFEILEKHALNNVKINGKVNTYRNVGSDWTLVLEKPTIQLAGIEIPMEIDGLEIHATDKKAIKKGLDSNKEAALKAEKGDL